MVNANSLGGLEAYTGQSNENASIESRNTTLKTALDQALRLRGSRRFDALADDETFVNPSVAPNRARDHNPCGGRLRGA